MRLCAAILFFVAFTTLAGDIPPNPAKAPPGMELGTWAIEEGDWGNSGTPEVVSVGAQRLLKLAYLGGAKDKTAFKHVTGLGLKRDGKIRLDVFTAEEKPPQVAVAVLTTKDYVWHESKAFDLKTGWNALEVENGPKEWKTQATEWKLATPITGAGDVRAVDILVYNGDKSGVLYVQGMTYESNAMGEKALGFIKDLQSEDPDKRDLAEKGLVAVGRAALEPLHQIADDERPEVLLRAASAIRQIEALPDDQVPDAGTLETVEKQQEFQGFDEARKKAEYTRRGLETERQRLSSLAKEARAQLEQGREELKKLKFTDDDKRKAYEESLDQLEATVKQAEQN